MKKCLLAASVVICLFAATRIYAQAEFTELYDLVPNRCFSAALTVENPGWLDIGIESGYDHGHLEEQGLHRGDTALS